MRIRTRGHQSVEAPAPRVVRDFTLPGLDRRERLRVMPFDTGMGKIAAQAVTEAGVRLYTTVLEGYDKQTAESKVSILAQELVSLGARATHAYEPLLDVVNVDTDEIAGIVSGWQVKLKPRPTVNDDTQARDIPASFDPRNSNHARQTQVRTLQSGRTAEQLVSDQFTELWNVSSVRGDDAMVTLLAMRELAMQRPETYEGGLAEHSLRAIQPTQTDISLK